MYDHYMTTFYLVFATFCLLKVGVMLPVFSFGGESQVTRNTAKTCRCKLVWIFWEQKRELKREFLSGVHTDAR